MTVKQYVRTFILGLFDYVNDTYRDSLVRDLRKVDPDIIRKGFDVSWKEGDLRHYVKQRRAMLYTSKNRVGNWQTPEDALPGSREKKLCWVRLIDDSNVYLLRWSAKESAWINWGVGNPKRKYAPEQVAAWAHAKFGEK